MRILIVGGGIAGLTLAWWLERYGHEPVVVERSPRLREEGYMMDFFGPGYEVAGRMGLLAELEQIHYQIPFFRFLRSDGSEKFSLDYRTLRRTLFDGRHFNFLRGDLEELLYGQVKDRVEVRFGNTVASFEQDEAQVHVTFANGTISSFDLLVGADGVHSRVRALAFGEEARFARFLGHYTASYVVDDPPRCGAPEDAFSTLTEPGRQVAVYPIRGGRLATFFLHRTHSVLTDLSPTSVRSELRARYGTMGWIVPELLERCDWSEVYFDRVEQIDLPSWSAGRMVLVGDACGCLSLLAGQGASMAMAGACVLAEELGRTGSDVAAACARYELRLRPEIQERQRAGRRMARWFVPEDRGRLLVRDVATRMSAWPWAAPLLRRRFVFGAMKL